MRQRADEQEARLSAIKAKEEVLSAMQQILFFRLTCILFNLGS